MLLLLVLFFPLLAAGLVYLSGNRLAGKVAVGLSLVEFGITAFMLNKYMHNDFAGMSYFREWITQPFINFSIAVDGIGILLVMLTNLLVPIIIFSNNDKEVENSRAFYALVLLMQFALIGVFVAIDGFLYYIFWELALIPIYFIALLWGEGKDRDFRNTAVFKFFIYTLAGSLFMLIGFIMVYQFTGSFAAKDLYNFSLPNNIQYIVFLMFFLAFAIKIPIMPFHTWQPETYKEAPTAGSMLLSGIMLKMGIYSLIRWLLPVVPHGAAFWTPLIIVLCIIGVVYGSIIAINQGHLKRLIAYSSLAHVGLIAAGVFSLSKAGLQGSVVQMVAHGVNVVALFFAGEIIYRRTGTYEIAQLGGIRNVAPKFATCFMIVVLASVALPLTNGFIGEFLLLYGVYEYNTILSVFAGLTIILGAVYMLRMYQRVMLGETNTLTAGFTDLTTSELMVFVPIIIIIFVLGVYPKPMLDIAQPAIDYMLTYALR
jgi:NADH-quinone oxidoreductase subunit M